MPKWKLFIWKMWQNSLALSDNLHRRNITPSAECCICLHDTEDNDHLFRSCPLAQEVWELDVGFNTGNLQLQPFREWLSGQILSFVGQDGFQGSLLPRFIGALRAIWRSRNAQIFNFVRATLDEFTVLFDLGLQEHALIADRAVPLTTSSVGRPPGFHMASFGQFDRASIDVLIRCDGAWDKDSHLATAAWVADICSSEYQVEDSMVLRASSALQAEAQACHSCLGWATINGFSQVMVYTDSASLVSAISSKSCSYRNLEHTLSEIRRFATSLQGCSIVKVSREDVAAAHDLAKAARNPTFPFVAN